MKPKVYNLAAMALLCLVALSTKTNAQQTPAAPASPPLPPTSYITPQVYTYIAPQQDYTSPLNTEVFTLLGTQDTTYNKKMRELQKQMSDLQKQMSQLRTEQYKKNSEEYTKRYAERNKEMTLRLNQRFSENFEKTFSEKFKNFGQNLKFNYNHADLDKKVESGEVKLKTKSYTKSYSVDRDDKLSINNSFGKVTVNTWNKNEFKVDVEIKAYADNEEKAGDLLDRISISDNKDNSSVTFATKIKEEDNRNTFWGTMSSNGKTSVRQAVINYTVYMPAKSSLSITNRFGGVTLPDLFGKVSINSSYGNFVAKSLTNADNNIKLQFVDASIENLVGTDLKMQYGSLNLNTANKINADFNFTPVKITRLNGTTTVNTRYGGLQIDNVERDVKNLSVTSNFTPIKLGSVGNADFDVTVHMAGFDYDDKSVNIESTTPDNNRSYSSTKTYKGHVGKGNSEKTITIKSTYGGVKFEQ